MKKLIILSSILAAGTTFAFADFNSNVYNNLGAGYLLGYWSFDSATGYGTPVVDYTAVSGYTPTSWTANEGNFSITQDADAAYAGAGYFSASSSGNAGPYVKVKNSGVGTTNFSGSYAISFWIQLNDTSSGTIFSAIHSVGNFGIWASGTTLNIGTSTTAGTYDSFDLSSYSGEWVNITVTNEGWEAHPNSSVYINGVAQEVTNTSKPQSQETQLQIGNSYGGNASFSSAGTLKNVALDEFAIWLGTSFTQAQILSYIPEPSFFGLLAGTLALGLAGARRRRRAK